MTLHIARDVRRLATSDDRRAQVLPRVGLVTIWYRAGAQLDRFVSDLGALRYSNLESVFVIHEQTSPGVRRLRQACPTATILHARRNLGTAAGWNLGIRFLLARGLPYIGIWNVDVQPDPRCLCELVKAMEADPTIGASQPLLLYADAPSTVEMFGGSLQLQSGAASHDYAGNTSLQELPALRDAQYLDGGTMLVRSSVLRQIGGFDEQLFMYDEDSDLSIRIRQAGHRTVAVRDARAWHYHRQLYGTLPAPHAVFYLARNRLYIVHKYAGRSAWLRLVGYSVVRVPRVAFFYVRRRSVVRAWAYLSGVIHGVLGAMGKRGWVE